MSKENDINYFDTTDIYRPKRSEELLGKTFNKKRKEIILISKASYRSVYSSTRNHYFHNFLAQTTQVILKNASLYLEKSTLLNAK